MIKTDFGIMTYSIGWKCQRSMMLFGVEYSITVKLQAYTEDAALPSKQLDSCKLFVGNENAMIKDIEKLMNDFTATFRNRFIPQTLLIKRNGSIALLCDDLNNPDEGVAISLYPEQYVISQDDYL